MSARAIPDSITLANARELASAGAAAFASDGKISLANLKTCDSSALAVLAQWRRTPVGGDTKPVELIHVPHNLRALATLYGVSTLLLPA